MEYIGKVEAIAITNNYYEILYYGLKTNQLIIQSSMPCTIKKSIHDLKVYSTSGLRVTAGRAHYQHPKFGQHIELHSALFDKNDEVEKDFANTFFHEIAHILAYNLTGYRGKGHGFTWAYCLQQFGFTPSRTYDSRKLNYRGYKTRAEDREIVELLNDIPDLGNLI